MERASDFLIKTVKVRESIIRKDASKKDMATISPILKRVRAWMEGNKPTDAQVVAYIKRHLDEIRMLMPGGNSPQAQSWEQRLNNLIEA